MQELNCLAIQKLDEDEVLLAAKLFENNYKLFPCALTAINYAAYLLDEHYHSFDGLKTHFNTFRRKRLAGKLLFSAMTNEKININTQYHLACLKGQREFQLHHYKQAKKWYQQAYQLKDNSMEAVTLLAWIAARYKQYDALLTYLEKMASLLKLGDDIEKNEEVIFECCPFRRFPYYLLQVMALYHVGKTTQANELLSILCDVVSSNQGLSFSPSDLMLVCLYLRQYDKLDKLSLSLKNPSWNRDEGVNLLIMHLLLRCVNNSHLYRLIKELWISTSFYSKCKLIFELLLHKTEFHIVYRFLYGGYANPQECHFIGCPIHTDKLDCGGKPI